MRILLLVITASILYLAYETYQTYTFRSAVFNAPNGQYIGPEDADLTVVEFIDYSCIYCQQLHPVITKAIQQDGNIKYIPRPVLSPRGYGQVATYMLHAAMPKNKFLEMHNYLMSHTDEPILQEEQVIAAAAEMGMDGTALLEDINTDDNAKRVAHNHNLFLRSGLVSTPGFLIGKKLKYVPSVELPDADEFKKLFEEARAMQ